MRTCLRCLAFVKGGNASKAEHANGLLNPLTAAQAAGPVAVTSDKVPSEQMPPLGLLLWGPQVCQNPTDHTAGGCERAILEQMLLSPTSNQVISFLSALCLILTAKGLLESRA